MWAIGPTFDHAVPRKSARTGSSQNGLVPLSSLRRARKWTSLDIPDRPIPAIVNVAKYPFEPYPDVPTLQQAVADSFCELIGETLKTQDTFTVSLSGGSTPKRVYEMLADRDLPWGQIHLFWGDERNVPHDHEDSNFRMVKTALLDKIAIDASNIHPVPVLVDCPSRAAELYALQLRDHFKDPLPQFDLTLLGMGDDAHTASLFPKTDAIKETGKSFVENFVPKFDAYRYTMTYPAIANSKQIWFIITGAAKKSAMEDVLFGERDLARYPSQGITPTRWFIDQAVVE